MELLQSPEGESQDSADTLGGTPDPVTYVVGVDTGGTFTDCVAVGGDGSVLHGKVLSTHATSPVDGILEGVRELAGLAGRPVDAFVAAIDRFSHGTTIGTNLVVERNGARVGLLATAGHGDALAMMRGRGRTAGVPAAMRANVRDTDKPMPIVPHRLVCEIPERVLSDGSVLVALDEAAARAAIEELLDQDVEAIAVALMWSFRNPAHERRLRELIHDERPELFVSLSSEVAPRQGEYERTVATVINAYVGPASSRYLGQLGGELAALGLVRAPFIMQSNGGVLPIADAAQQPVRTIGSGPAGGLAGTANIARRSGHRNVIATDMGGTSFEVGLLLDGRPVLSAENVIDNYTFRVSQLDVRSIACGGGSIARVDPHSGGLRVGPQSAGSSPGPACYGRGQAATVTDADVVLGLIDPGTFLGSRMALDRDAAIAAVGRLAKPMGLSLEEVASGIIRVNDANAATLIKQRTIEQGLDPRDFVVYAFGGAGPVHAFHFAQELGVSRVVVPIGNGASTLSAYGIAASEVVQIFELECSFVAPFDLGELQTAVAALEERALKTMALAGFDRDAIVLERSALARYAEQLMQELELPLPTDLGATGVAEEITEGFRARYERLYGAAALAVFQAVELFTLRISARVDLGTGELTSPPASGSAEADHLRLVYWPGSEHWIETGVHFGTPPRGVRIDGPAILQLPHTSISVGPGQHLDTDSLGNAVLTITEGGS